MLTTEYYNGVKQRVYQNFRKYPTWLESINDHSAMFNRMDRYKNLRNCQDYEEACTNVKKDGYATAPDYAQTLIKTVKKYKLWLWDFEVLKHYSPDKLRTVKQGSDGGGVYLLQKLLVEHGYALSLDGQFGGQTDYCLRNYQQKKGLVIDGICGPKTWAALKK
jgi:peptidoglycan hydrolase-like protein with peptidoglycan-binding domain